MPFLRHNQKRSKQQAGKHDKKIIMLVATELMVKFFKHVFGCTNCWLDAARHLLTTTAWRFDFARTARAFGDLYLGSIVQLKTVIDPCDITFCTAGVDCHSTFIARISGHHIVSLRIEIKQENDDRTPGVCPYSPVIFGIMWCSK